MSHDFFKRDVHLIFLVKKVMIDVQMLGTLNAIDNTEADSL